MNNGVDLRHLRYFLCLAEELHFGKAAERLGIAQAPLSQQIRLMEDRLGVSLFHRTTRRTRLTSAGQTLMLHAREILDAADRAVAHTRAMSSETTGRLSVAGVNVALTHVLPPILAEFRKLRPAVIVDVIQLGTGEQLRTLETGEINVAFIRSTERAAFMQVETILSEGFIAALPRGHRLAQKDEIALSDFMGEALIGYAPILGANYVTIMMTALRKAGLQARVVRECTHTMSVATQVASGLGVAIMPSWIANIRSPYLEFRPIPELPRAIDLVVAWPNGDGSPLVRDFIDTTRRVARQLAKDHVLDPQLGSAAFDAALPVA
ncbi:LysR substrate-binding domain-containing protein [Nitratireductor indicus]|uniref:LysR family transcriptional regulator n=1 Tax=Nitratireductor indicus C115 TaxID=1231190 RepID=K2PGH7_9HYPH|nr:LysR substrate-binding domain-containing protein [Nitratireductor indicus]EKF40147.1 LysR family transcriptional regulator [Nitratireductor indicus C115]MDS1138136.1 LysR substrate-binding domain-containing protein [Nitratireductor indicus]SFQ81395.1 DNA-binding transcriptional regulator, LysR family [Nitratireductor indicus]